MPIAYDKTIPVLVNMETAQDLKALMELTELRQTELLRYVLTAGLRALLAAGRMSFPLRFTVDETLKPVPKRIDGNGLPLCKLPTETMALIQAEASKPIGPMTQLALAKWLHVSTKTVRYWVQRNEVPHFKVGSRIQFNADDVAKWLRERHLNKA